jgi:hypothetical protein
VIEANSSNMTSKYKEYIDLTTKELKEYELTFKQIENEYNTAKKKKDSALADVNKVFLFLFFYFFLMF